MYKVHVQHADDNYEFICNSTEDVLTAARKQFIPFPTGCRRGGCGVCKVKVLSGSYSQDSLRSKEALTDDEMRKRYVLACKTLPESDLTLTIEEEQNQKSRKESAAANEMITEDRKDMLVLYDKPVLSQELSSKMMDAICHKAKELGILINVAIVDDGGNLKTFVRMDEAPLLSGTIAQNKAYTAASFGLPTHEWYPLIKDEPALLHGIVHTERLVVFGGGFPLKYNGYVLGGIGVSGGTAEQDVICAKEGLKIFNELS